MPAKLTEHILHLAEQVANGELSTEAIANQLEKILHGYTIEERRQLLTDLKELAAVQPETPSVSHYLLAYLAYQVSRYVDDEEEVAASAYLYGTLCYSVGRFAEALMPLEKAIHISQNLGKKLDVASISTAIGSTYIQLNHPNRAIIFLEQAHEIALQIDEPKLDLTIVRLLGEANQLMENFERAEYWYQQALTYSRRLERLGIERETQYNLGNLLLRFGRLNQATSYFQDALQLSQNIGDISYVMRCFRGMGKAHLRLGQTEQATTYLQRATNISQQIGDLSSTSLGLMMLGDAYLQARNRTQATEYYHSALSLASELESKEIYTDVMQKLEVLQYSRVSFPAKCVKGQIALLKIQLTTSQQEVEARPIKIPFPIEQKEVTLTVVITSEAFDVFGHKRYESWQEAEEIAIPQNPERAEPYELMRTSIHEDSEAVVFALMPREDAPAGPHEIVIDFFKKARRIGNLIVETSIGNPHPGGEANVTGVIPQPSDIHGEDIAELKPKATIHASTTLRGENRYIKYLIIDADRTPFPIEGGETERRINREQAMKFVNELTSDINSWASHELQPEEYESIIWDLHAMGAGIYHLLPEDLQDYMKSLPKKSLVYIHTSEELHWVPWELVSDGREFFWGERLILSRLPERFLKRDVQSLAHVNLSCGAHFLSSDISRDSAIRDEAKNTFIELDAGDLVPLREDCIALQLSKLHWPNNVMGGLLHFTCHGKSDDMGRYLRLGPNSLTMILRESNVRTLPLENCAIVFANACESSQVMPFLDGFISFGNCFTQDAKAQSFIGTLGTVPTQPAVKFARTFYEYVFQGIPIGKALYCTKQKFKQQKDPFWLLYCLYGKAETVITK